MLTGIAFVQLIYRNYGYKHSIVRATAVLNIDSLFIFKYFWVRKLKTVSVVKKDHNRMVAFSNFLAIILWSSRMSLITLRIGRDNGGLRKWDCCRQLERVTSTVGQAAAGLMAVPLRESRIASPKIYFKLARPIIRNLVPYQVVRLALYATTSALSRGSYGVSSHLPNRFSSRTRVCFPAHAWAPKIITRRETVRFRCRKFVRRTRAEGERNGRPKADVWRGFLREMRRLGLHLRNSPFEMQKLCRARAIIFFMQKCKIIRFVQLLWWSKKILAKKSYKWELICLLQTQVYFTLFFTD